MPRLFHISEMPGITRFDPRPSPSFFENVTGNVVFAIEERLLHNYLLPRDCPRVCFYARADSNPADIARFLGAAPFGMILERSWQQRIDSAVLYVYELPPGPFVLLDAGAGYYISYSTVAPLAVQEVRALRQVLIQRQVAIHWDDRLHIWADAIRHSSLQFSLIRMRNALP